MKKQCPYCGLDPMTRGGWTRDHVTPVYRGGLERPDNYLGVCRVCNEHKRDWLLSEWVVKLDRSGDDRAPHVRAVIDSRRVLDMHRLIDQAMARRGLAKAQALARRRERHAAAKARVVHPTKIGSEGKDQFGWKPPAAVRDAYLSLNPGGCKT